MQTAHVTSCAAASEPLPPPSPDATFAALLAGLAAPATPEAPWNDDALADDVATITYERALRAHSRSTPNPLPSASSSDDHPVDPDVPRPAQHPPKNASITIRLSETECAQLRRRAAEAGMTVSAYLRSCTLEVEALRAQVKETLAQLRSSAPTQPPDPIARRSQTGAGESHGSMRRPFAHLLHRLARLFRIPRRSLGLNPANPFAPVRN